MTEPTQPPKSAPRRTSRRRIIFRSVVVAFVVVFGWIGVLVGLQLVSDDPYEFRPEITDALTMIRDGKARDLYWESSPRMRKAMTEDSFEIRGTRLNQTLGEFREILGTSDAVIHDRAQGKTGWVRANLQFARAKTTGSFSWHWDPKAEKWRLFGYYIEIPPPFDKELAKKQESREARSEAPAEVIELVDTIMKKMRDGKVREVWEQAHPSFRETVPFSQFEERYGVRRREMGSYVRILDTTSHGRDEGLKKAWVTAVLEYSKTQTTATLDFWNTDGTWRLSRFVVQIPEPEIPRRPSAPGAESDAGATPAP